MRLALTFLMLSLVACAERDGSRLRTGQPGLNVARAAMSSGSPDVAAKIAEGLLARNPQDIGALLSQGDALAAMNRPNEAVTSYAKALALDPGAASAKIGVGRLRLATDPAQAELLFLSVLEREPRNAVALNNLGIAHDLQGDHASAQNAYRRALAADPAMRAAEVNLALSLALNGQATNAAQILAPLARGPDASRRLRHDLAAVLTMAGEKEAARKILSEDLSPEQIERALLGYEALGSAAPVPGT
jgi:Flp pilus assembly protein TadD